MRTFLLAIFSTTLLLATPTQSEEGIAVLRETSKGFSEVAKKAIPAVVFIETEISPGSSCQTSDSDDFYNRFFGIPGKRDRTLRGRGSGFFISSDGYILTNTHVIKDSSRISVLLNDGREYEAKIVGADPNTEVALIKVEGDNFPYLNLGDSNNLEIGEWVIAIGNPFEFQSSLTVGVVSAKGRSGLNITNWESFIQTDAAINPGNSGGPLLNLNCEVIGINTALVSGSGGYMGIGFAIPSNIAKFVANHLMESGQVTRGYLGVKIQPLNPDLAKEFGLESSKGVIVLEVEPGSPAAQAGLQPGDVILTYNEKTVESAGQFQNEVTMMEPGTKLSLKINRNGGIKIVETVIASHPQDAYQKTKSTLQSRLGISVENLSPELAKKLGYSQGEGVLVTEVDPKSAAAYAYIRAGSLILAVNRQRVNNTTDFYRLVDEAIENKKRVLLLVKFGQQAPRFISLSVN